MADPDLRYTDNIGLAYPAKDLDPWDDKYVTQMADLDRAVLYATQLSEITFDKGDFQNYLTYDGITKQLAGSAPIRLYCAMWGGIITIPTFSFVLSES
jgi:hypothetical protein